MTNIAELRQGVTEALKETEHPSFFARQAMKLLGNDTVKVAKAIGLVILDNDEFATAILVKMSES